MWPNPQFDSHSFTGLSSLPIELQNFSQYVVWERVPKKVVWIVESHSVK